MRNLPLIDQGRFVLGFAPAVPSTSTPGYVSLKEVGDRVTVVIIVKNATTVTGSAITLKQATAVAGTAEKALAFDTVYVNADTAASDLPVRTAVTSNTFTTAAVNSKNMIYQIEVKAADLDVTNGFDCIRAGVGDATAATVTVLYFMHSARVPATLANTSNILD